MKTSFKLGAALMGSAVLLGAGAAAYAQAPAAAPRAAPAAQAQFRAHRHERMEARVTQVHEALNLRPNQEAAWQAMVGEIRQGVQEGRGRHMPQTFAPMTTPQRLDFMAQRMADRQARFQRASDSIKRFYAQLDPAQQKVFDATAMTGRGFGMMGMMGGGRGGMHRHGMHGGMGRHMGPPPAAPVAPPAGR